MKRLFALLVALLFLAASWCCCAETAAEGWQIAYDDFTYDKKVTWHSSYSDIVALYGEPDEIRYIYDVGPYADVTYHNAEVIGVGGFDLIFHFNVGSGELYEIQIMYYTDRVEEISEYYNTLYASVESRFGKSIVKNYEVIAGVPFYSDSWTGVVEDTLIAMNTCWYPDRSNGEAGMVYFSERPFSDLVVYSDLPVDMNGPQE